MTSTPKAANRCALTEDESSTPSPLAGPGPGGHKPSFKSTKLARRARSFKDDFLGKISQMRSPAGPGLRSHSPNNKGVHCRNTPKSAGIAEHHVGHHKGAKELEALWKQTQIALKHFRDVVSKQKLEMLPGNGTIVLDTVWAINLEVRSAVAAENSSSITSATHRMYQSVARLIKLCDDVLIDAQSSELDKENVNEIVAQVEDSVKNLIQLAQEKIMTQHNQHSRGYKTTPRQSFASNNLEIQTQRNSLPDIPLTPRERQILEQTSCISPAMVRSSHSTESILRESSPPPKPPLPSGLCKSELNNSASPPPLPPKKKSLRSHLVGELFGNPDSPMRTSLERVSMRSKSPDDSISLLSEGTGSLDSMLNHSSKEEDEIKALMECDDMLGDCHTSDIFGNNSWEESSLSSSVSNHNNIHNNDNNHTFVNEYHRLSNTDSGIVSSYRSSSYSKRSSQQSSSSSQFVSSSARQIQASDMAKSESVLQNLNRSFENRLSVSNFNQKSSTSSSNSMVVKSSSNHHSTFSEDNLSFLCAEDAPPVPQKTRKKTERQPSPYDNVPADSIGDDIHGELLVTCHKHQSQQSFKQSTASISSGVVDCTDGTKPPPLPPKKKHIMAYMEMFGNCSHTNDQEFMRHSVHMVQCGSAAAGASPSPGLPTTQSCSFSHHVTSSVTSAQVSRSSHTQSLCVQPTSHHSSSSLLDQRIPSPLLHSPNPTSQNTSNSNTTTVVTPPALPPKQRTRKSSARSPPSTPTGPSNNNRQSPPVAALPDLLEHTTAVNNIINNKNEQEISPSDSIPCMDFDLIYEMSAEQFLVWKKPEEDGPDLRGGPTDALIIQATKATKNGVFTYQEAFLTTYRTFISPYDLISKLIKRYNHFYYQPDKKPRSREAFALIVRVVSDLTTLDLDEKLQHLLMDFVQQLIASTEIILAKALRVKHLERHEAKQMALKYTNVVSSLTLCARNFTLLDFKSEQIAEQMTLLDADLFMKIEIPEVLIWAQEQNEERSPNLTRFTEHFNKMSYWARTKILTAENKDVREKYFMKFIKIMKHLRKINNFNSYLALLSALDSAPVRRLEWQKQVQEGLKEYCALIDSSSSFRAYRMALAETQPPCIPYIGLVLQDLTFVHIGNSNLLPDGTINFSKRWQQFNIVENMKKFKKATYTFKKQEKIIQFFQNFDDCIGEDAMWKLSETIKPRGGKKT